VLDIIETSRTVEAETMTTLSYFNIRLSQEA
jgi:hypothetical protein